MIQYNSLFDNQMLQNNHRLHKLKPALKKLRFQSE